jgi:alpha-beta hydrolase superfamily lysophospholipase
MVSGGQERTRVSGEPVELVARDGVRLRGELLWPTADSAGQAAPTQDMTPCEPKVVVALSHAMLVDRRTLDQPPGEGLLSQLRAEGALVFWFDQRGHGRSTPLPRQGARWDYDDLVDDAGVVAAYLAERFPGLPRVAVGHSLFGHVALAWQALVSANAAPLPPRKGSPTKVGFDGLVLLGANVWLPQLEPSRARWWFKRGFYPLLVLAGTRHGFLPARRLRVGTADEPLPYLQQLGRWLGEADWTAQSGHSYLADLPQVRVPILSVASVGDRLLAVPACQLRFACRTQGSVSHITVGHAFGHACEPDHMGLVLDERMAPIWREIAAWAGRVPVAA